MNLYQIMAINLLLLFKKADTIAEALEATGIWKSRADEMANTVIASLSSDCLEEGGKANLYAGFGNLPLEKQFSLRLLVKNIDNRAVKNLLINMYQVKQSWEGNADVYPSSEEAWEMFKIVEPVFQLLKIGYIEHGIKKMFEV